MTIAAASAQLHTSKRMTPRQADIVYALEGFDGIEKLFALAPQEWVLASDESVEVVIQLRVHSTRMQGHISARLAAYFEGGVAPFVAFVDPREMHAPSFMHRAVALTTLSPVEREEARARHGLRKMRQDASRAVARRAARDRRACVEISHEGAAEIERAIARVDAEIRSFPPTSVAFLDIALADIRAGEIDLFVLDAQTVSRYPSLVMPFEVARFASILERATRWRRGEVLEWGDAESSVGRGVGAPTR